MWPAHELSGDEGRDEPDAMATGTKEGEVPRCVTAFEAKRPSARDAAELSERSFRRYRQPTRRLDHRLDKASARRVPMGPAAWMLQEVFAMRGLPGALCTASVSRDFTPPGPPWRAMQRWTVPQPSLNPAWQDNGAGPQWRRRRLPRPAPDVPHCGPGDEPACAGRPATAIVGVSAWHSPLSPTGTRIAGTA